MLKKINAGRVESDNGFFIHVTGLESVRYQENNMFIDLTWTYDPKVRKTFVFFSEITNWDQPEGKTISENEREKIIKNIKEALKLLPGNFEII